MLPVFRSFTLIVLLTASAFGQSPDISGWSDLRWGTTKGPWCRSRELVMDLSVTVKIRIAQPISRKVKTYLVICRVVSTRDVGVALRLN